MLALYYIYKFKRKWTQPAAAPAWYQISQGGDGSGQISRQGGHPAPGRDMKGAADLPGREISGSDSRGGKFKSREP